MSTPLGRAMANPRKEAADALAELVDALRAAGITLPSLAIDWRAVCTGIVLVELGAARPDVIRRLAAVIRKGAAR
ncbi:hypothetical protein P3T36_004422 [Kitasatospora sp. MAP12-15]|uniref:hypothetical protein n=1 Tax=unclassified Kitasatospora TaxID=2633591 RepID=UPI002474E367|nr:hypothetical protein [Kitasatospora sp. MAP12-44]MDH6110848.1 hypothetical protein [Kitasatospora sp. MAP12-44]